MEATLNEFLKDAGLTEETDRQDVMELMGKIERNETFSVATDLEELLLCVAKYRERNRTQT